MSGEYIRHWKFEIKRLQEQRRLRNLDRKPKIEDSWETNPSMVDKCDKDESNQEFESQ